MRNHKKYSCIVFFPDGKPKKWRFVTELDGFAGFLNRDHSQWTYMNVYCVQTKEYLKRFFPHSNIPKAL